MELNFNDFKNRALDQSLSKWEKIGFPDEYRKNQEKLIFEDIYTKLDLITKPKKILDIGCGCTELVEYIIEHSKFSKSELYLIDSKEMLDNITSSSLEKNIHLISGYFPNIENLKPNSFDSILVYSVLQYVFLEQSLYKFIHKCIDLLKPGGRLLLGDIPNISARTRFLNSEDGIKFKNNIVDLNNSLQFKHENEERIDDTIVLSILSRYRNFNCETYLLPQPATLPFGNRREDILIIKR